MIRRILGIDPGSRITGYGIVEQSGQHPPQCLVGGCLRLKAQELPNKLAELFVGIQEIVRTYQPTELAIEQVFVHKNVRSALVLGHARGVAIAAVMTLNIPVFEYAPRQIKLAVTGTGNAEKSQIQQMMKILLRLEAVPQTDCADALAVALCHLHRGQHERISVGAGNNVKRRGANSRKLWKQQYDRTNTR